MRLIPTSVEIGKAVLFPGKFW